MDFLLFLFHWETALEEVWPAPAEQHRRSRESFTLKVLALSCQDLLVNGSDLIETFLVSPCRERGLQPDSHDLSGKPRSHDTAPEY